MTHGSGACEDQDSEPRVSLSINYCGPEGPRLNLDNVFSLSDIWCHSDSEGTQSLDSWLGCFDVGLEGSGRGESRTCGITFMKDVAEFSQAPVEWLILRMPSPQQALTSQTLFTSVWECLFSPTQYLKTGLQVTLLIVPTEFSGSCSCSNNSRKPT